MLNKRFFKAKKRLLKWTSSILLVVNGKENGKKNNFFFNKITKTNHHYTYFSIKRKRNEPNVAWSTWINLSTKVILFMRTKIFKWL